MPKPRQKQIGLPFVNAIARSAALAPPPSLTPLPAKDARQMHILTRAETLVFKALDDPITPLPWPPQVSSVLDKLTLKQRIFVIRTAVGEPPATAYRVAYDVRPDRTEESLHIEACVNLKHPKVSAALIVLRQYLDTKWMVDAAKVREFAAAKFLEEAHLAEKAGDRLRATEDLVRLSGGFIDRKEITHREVTALDTQEELLSSILGDIQSLNLPDSGEQDQSYQQIGAPSIGAYRCQCGRMAGQIEPAAADGLDGDGI